MRYTPNGQAVCSFSMAVNRRWTDPQGAVHDETTWYRVSTWGKLAETCSQYLTKGRLVLVEGERLKVNAFTNREGQAAASIELTAQTVKFLGGRDGAQGQGAPAQGAAGGRPANNAVPAYEGYGQMSEDEIPF
ncbi:MAG: single-stranded DNA-binding protein [Anaerolineae bacterium]|nr:single-stranded DNA-binding protein [Anaerolineae bacterium]